MKRHARRGVVFAIALLAIAIAATTAAAQRIQTAALRADVDGFFDREVASHFLQIPASGPLPERVHGALTTGEFSWGTFVRALAAYADTRGTRMVGGRDVIPLIGRVVHKADDVKLNLPRATIRRR